MCAKNNKIHWGSRSWELRVKRTQQYSDAPTQSAVDPQVRILVKYRPPHMQTPLLWVGLGQSGDTDQ